MNRFQMMKNIILGALFTLHGFAHAEHLSNIEFFASNNTHIIDIEKAYKRLNSEVQSELENTVVTILQKNHIEQGRFEDILGIYQMTADNSVIFYSSPKQYFSNKQIFLLAIQLAKELKQESIAVFIPSKSASVSDITVTLNTQSDIQDTLKLIHKKLPQYYSSAFSLHLTKARCEPNQIKVNRIEWLGSKIDTTIIKKVFPNEKITYQLGKSYLVYSSGLIKLL